jgi:hypothetical protein
VGTVLGVLGIMGALLGLCWVLITVALAAAEDGDMVTVFAMAVSAAGWGLACGSALTLWLKGRGVW